jgi:hypothetical protein
LNESGRWQGNPGLKGLKSSLEGNTFIVSGKVIIV